MTDRLPLNIKLAFLSDSGSESNVAQLCDNGSVEAARDTPLFSGKVLDSPKLGTFNQYPGKSSDTLRIRTVAKSPRRHRLSL